jgi:hypothetical protein
MSYETIAFAQAMAFFYCIQKIFLKKCINEKNEKGEFHYF